jgi:ubiquinone/menaquinone biosynthesis C-methylase UbiE
MALTASAARAFYDRFGKKQDLQGFYEDPAITDLLAHADLGHAQQVFEFGCGTGKLAARLLADHLPATATYLGGDLSQTMVGLSARRLAPFAPRAEVVQTDGAVRFPQGDGAVDRVVSTYVLDLLSDGDTRLFFAEAYRVLEPGGKLCLVSLTRGCTPVSRVVSSLWMAVFRLRATLVGGCRPVSLTPYLDEERWQVEHRGMLTSFGVSSEVLVAVKTRPPTDRPSPEIAPT